MPETEPTRSESIEEEVKKRSKRHHSKKKKSKRAPKFIIENETPSDISAIHQVVETPSSTNLYYHSRVRSTTARDTGRLNGLSKHKP